MCVYVCVCCARVSSRVEITLGKCTFSQINPPAAESAPLCLPERGNFLSLSVLRYYRGGRRAAPSQIRLSLGAFLAREVRQALDCRPRGVFRLTRGCVLAGINRHTSSTEHPWAICSPFIARSHRNQIPIFAI